MSFKLLPLYILVGAVSLSAAAITTVHDTGVDASNTVLSIGSSTSFWTLISEPGTATETIGSNPFRYFNGAYYVDNSLSGWVSPGANGNAGAGGFYTYALSFDLTGFNAATAVITGTYGTDNDGSILLNGNTVATTADADFGHPTTFTMNTGFVAGVNTITVRVDNNGDPTAFRVEFASATADPIGVTGVPEPGTFVLMSGGLAAVLLFRKRIRRVLPIA